VRLIIDLKRDGTEAPLARLIGALELWDRVIVGGFDDRRIERFRRLTAGRVATSTGPRATFGRWLSAMARREPAPAAALQVPERYGRLPVVRPRTVERFSAAGAQVHVWTVNEKPDMHRLLDWGVHGLITDRPDHLREVLEERGSWTGAS
jgi:glycerophosphoryl diester phosphodiesterase